MSERGSNPLWGGRFGASPAEAFERLNASIPFDIRLAPYDIQGSIAHARMLGERGIIPVEEVEDLVRGLRSVLEEVWSGRFSWALSDEDVHTAVERRLRELVGDAALGGTPHPVDPALTAETLGMEPLVNSLDAVSERDFALDLLYACTVLGVHLSRLGEEWVLWTSSEFGFVRLDDAYSSGSSIMPQKKNPDAYELMRGKAGRLIGNLNALLVTLKGLPPGYSKDLQEDKEPLFDSVDSVLAMLAVLPEMLRTASFDGARMKAAAGGFALATELADYLAAHGVPFREAHRVVGQLVRRCEEVGVTLEEVPAEELTAAHPILVGLPRDLLTPEGSVANKKSTGSTSPASVEEQLERARKVLG